MARIEDHRVIQAIAKQALAELGPTLVPSDTELSITLRLFRILAEFGIRQTWYYNCPALVLAGHRTCLSQSGREYMPQEEQIGLTNLVTVDLSPSEDGIWGDCARSFCFEDGVFARVPKSPEFLKGQQVLQQLHVGMQNYVTPDTTFGELCDYAMSEIAAFGFENLDAIGNVGHTIESDLSERDFIEPGKGRPLGSASLFTFEPHIRAIHGRWGFKHEEIYYFADGRIQTL